MSSLFLDLDQIVASVMESQLKYKIIIIIMSQFIIRSHTSIELRENSKDEALHISELLSKGTYKERRKHCRIRLTMKTGNKHGGL